MWFLNVNISILDIVRTPNKPSFSADQQFVLEVQLLRMAQARICLDAIYVCTLPAAKRMSSPQDLQDSGHLCRVTRHFMSLLKGHLAMIIIGVRGIIVGDKKTHCNMNTHARVCNSEDCESSHTETYLTHLNLKMIMHTKFQLGINKGS